MVKMVFCICGEWQRGWWVGSGDGLCRSDLLLTVKSQILLSLPAKGIAVSAARAHNAPGRPFTKWLWVGLGCLSLLNLYFFLTMHLDCQLGFAALIGLVQFSPWWQRPLKQDHMSRKVHAIDLRPMSCCQSLILISDKCFFESMKHQNMLQTDREWQTYSMIMMKYGSLLWGG